MFKSIELTKLDDLFKEYKDFKHENESFSSFVESTTDNEIPVWNWTDSIGVVTPEDFQNNYSKEFIDKNFKELANCWFKGLNGQIDFRIVSECVCDNIKEKK